MFKKFYSLSRNFKWSSKYYPFNAEIYLQYNLQFAWEVAGIVCSPTSNPLTRMRLLYWFCLEFSKVLSRNLRVRPTQRIFSSNLFLQANRKKYLAPAVLQSHYIDLSIKRVKLWPPFKKFKITFKKKCKTYSEKCSFQSYDSRRDLTWPDASINNFITHSNILKF
jgi:hypothetical protein